MPILYVADDALADVFRMFASSTRDDVRVEPTEVRTDDTAPVLRRGLRVLAWVAAIALLLFVLDQLGVPVSDWIRDFFDQLRAVPADAIAGGIVLETLQTVFVALAWLTVLRAAFPDTDLPFRPVLASYAVAVALNSFLPANIGSLVMLLMFTTLIASATFAAVLSGLIAQKIPFSVFNVAAYIYLFATVAGSLSIKLGFVASIQSPAASSHSAGSCWWSFWRASSGFGRPNCASRSKRAARSSVSHDGS